MNFELFLVLLHIVSSIVMIAGIAGRQLTRTMARKSTEINNFYSFVELSRRFDELFVIPGSMLLFLFGVTISYLRGWPLFGFIQGSSTNWLLASMILYFSAYLLVIFIFRPKGKIFKSELNNAIARNKITQELVKAYNDRAVRLAHLTEYVLIGLVIYLMVMKPF